MAQIPPIAAAQFGLFTSAQAARVGWSNSSLSRASLSGRLARIRHGVFGDPELVGREPQAGDDVPQRPENRRLMLLSAAAALKIDRGVAGGQAAALMLGLPVFGPTAQKPCLVLPPGIRIIETHTHLHRIALGAGQVLQRGEVRLTDSSRTCLDLARERGLIAGLVAADHACRLGLTGPVELALAYKAMRGRGGSPAAREVVELVDGRHESVLETISALELRWLPAPPEPQVTLRTATGEFVARVDFFFAELGLVGEADGKAKYAGDALWQEKRREDRLRNLDFMSSAGRMPRPGMRPPCWPRSGGRSTTPGSSARLAFWSASFPNLL